MAFMKKTKKVFAASQNNPTRLITVAGKCAENDAGTRSVEELRRDIMTRLTLFMQRRVAQAAAKP